MEIKYGYCHCGCGEKTLIINKNHTKRGYIKGEPRNFVNGHQNRTSPVEYIINKKTGCWEWQRSKVFGYGKLTKNYKQYPAHRFYYIKYKGEIPEGMLVCHHCDNPPCVNPDHLFLGTAKDNMNDCKNKGRVSRWEKCGASKLVNKQVTEIRKLYKKSKCSYDYLAEIYKVNRRTIFRIINNKTWIGLH